MKITLAPNEFLDDYVLGCEFARNAEISGNAYLFWSGAICAKFENSRIVFLHKKRQSDFSHCLVFTHLLFFQFLSLTI